MGHRSSATSSTEARQRIGAFGRWRVIQSRALGCGIVVAAALVLAQPAGAAISFVGAICHSSDYPSGTTLSCQPTATVAAGDLVIVSISWNNNAGTVSVADNGVSTAPYTCYSKNVNAVSMQDVVCARQLTAPLTTANTITVTGPAGFARAMYAFDFSGVQAAAVVGSNGGTSTGSVVHSGSVTTQLGEVLEFGSFSVRQDVLTSTFTAGSRCSVTTSTACTVNANCPSGEFCAAFTFLGRDGISGQSFNRAINSEYRTSLTGPQTLEATGTLEANHDYAAQIVVFSGQPSPSPTNSSTPTTTPTPTITQTFTPSNTPTNTPTPTSTATPTVALCGTPAPANACVPGGGKKLTDCFLEFAPNPVPARKTDAFQTPKQTLICYEGDPACDINGPDGPNASPPTCTIQTRLCINNHDPRLGCTASDILKYQVLAPAPSSGDIYNQTNLQTLENQGGAGGFNVKVYRGKTAVYDPQPPTPTVGPNSGVGECSPLLPIQVPLRANRGKFITGRRTLRLKVTTSSGTADTDALYIQCRKSTCGDGVIQADHETCDNGGLCQGGSRDGLNCITTNATLCPGGVCVRAVIAGCDTGCHIILTPTPTPTNQVANTPTNTPTNTALVSTPTRTPTTQVNTPTQTSGGGTATATQTPGANTPTATQTPGGNTPTPTATGGVQDTPTLPPDVTPGFEPRACNLVPAPSPVTAGNGTGAVLGQNALPLAPIGLPLSGTQVWQFGPPVGNTRSLVISRSHFDCAATTLLSFKVKICARLDPTNYCQGGANDGQACPPADCGGNPCSRIESGGTVDCAPAGGSLTGYDSLVQIDHDTNKTLVGGSANKGFPIDANCTATFTDPDGVVLHSCIEPTFAPGTPGTPTATPASTPTPLAAGAQVCSGAYHNHPNICNSPAEQTFSGTSTAGGFKLHEALAIGFSLQTDPNQPAEDCTTTECQCDSSAANTNGTPCTPGVTNCGTGYCDICPHEDCPAQSGDIAIAGEITSGLAKGVLWNVGNTTTIFGTTGTGVGANSCNGPCPSVVQGQGIDLSSTGGDCLTDVPRSMNGAKLALVYPALDLPSVGDIIAALTLQCGP